MVFLLFIVLRLNMAAQSPPELEYLTSNDGLSANYVSAIHQDQIGYYWFGTMDGLNRYDGESFRIFRRIPGDSTSLSDNFIKDLAEDSAGRLFIATHTGGLNRYDPAAEKMKRIILRNESGGVYERLSTLNCNQEGIVWIGTQNGYLLRYNSQADSLEWWMSIPSDFDNTSANAISGIYPDTGGNLWLASGLGGLDYLPSSGGEIQHVLLADTLAESFRRDGCGGIIADEEGTLWISRVSGLDSYDPETGAHKHFGFKDSKGEMLKAYDLAWSPDGDIILNSYHDILKFDPRTGSHEVITSILPEYFTPALLLDGTGIIWAGTMGYGAIKIDPRKGRFNTGEGNFLMELFPDEMKMLTDSNGVDSNLRDRDFLSVIRDRHGSVWVATPLWGCYRIAPDRSSIRKYHIGEQGERNRFEPIYQVFEDRTGGIWFSTVGGMSKLDVETGELTYHRLYPGSNRADFALNKSGYLDISCIYQDEQHVFWLGTPELGLIRYDSASGSVQYLPVTLSRASGVRSYAILDMAVDSHQPDSILWLGTEGGGLVRFEKHTGQAAFITMQQGLPSNTINCVFALPNGDLWMSTNLGLSRYTPSTGQTVNFDVRDGLQSNGFNRREGYLTEDGELYFGGPRGFNHFFPGDIRQPYIAAPLVLTGIRLLNEPVHFGDPEAPLQVPLFLLKELVLDYRQAMMVTFTFTTLTGSDQHRLRYAYKLENFDDRWINNGSRRSATYTNLNPGSYRLRVRHLDSIEVENVPKISLALLVLPPFWATWWFRSGTIVLLLLVISELVRKQLRKKAVEREREKRFSQQLIQSQEDERRRIAEDLHDSIGQSLLIIKNKLIVGLRHFTSPPESVKFLNEASELTSQTLKDIRQVTRNLRPVDLDHLGLTQTIKNMLEKIDASANFSIQTKIENIDGVIASDNQINLYRIIQEALNNIIKHSGASEVRFELLRKPEALFLSIEDNGSGFDLKHEAEVEGKGFGVQGMFERAKILSARLNFYSAQTGGTRIVLTIPILEMKK